MGVWEQVFIEPRWLIIFGLFMDLIGGTLIAATAWFRLKLAVDPLALQMGITGSAEESGPALKWRRCAVVAGGILLGLGFGLQMYATWLQIP